MSSSERLKVTHLLVDEVHERGVETDFMLTFLKQVGREGQKNRIVVRIV